MDLATLIALCRHGWALPVLAALGDGIAPRYYALSVYLGGASRDALLASVEHLRELGYVTPHTGYGHPLRPEIALTEAGAALSQAAMRIWQTADTLHATAFVRKRWGLPLLAVLQCPMSFGALRAQLCPVTDRGLSLLLKEGQAAQILARAVIGDVYPPATLYTPLKKGLAICEAIRD